MSIGRITSCIANAGARVFSGSSADPNSIVQGALVLGTSAIAHSPDYITGLPLTVGTMVHELGHLLGLAHSVVNQETFIETDAANTRYLPTMLAGSINNLAFAPEQDRLTLNPDDIAGISVLYPSENMEENTTTIRGEVLKADGTPMQYVNVIARNIEDPLCEAYSFLSGRICPEGTHTSGLGGALS